MASDVSVAVGGGIGVGAMLIEEILCHRRNAALQARGKVNG
jgi:hypothetical protein